jgi:hypothetical protein
MCAAALATTALASGCGDSGSATGGGYNPEASTTVSISGITKAQFVRRVNAVCRRAWIEVIGNWRDYLRSQQSETGGKPTLEEVVRLSLLGGIDFHIFDEILRVGAPIGQEDDIERIVGPFQIAVELGWKKRWRARSMDDVYAQFNEYNDGARRYGLRDCPVDESNLGSLES